MKNLIWALPALALAGCMEAGMESAMAPAGAITSEAQFLQLVADRRIALQGSPENNFVIASGGTLDGTFGGARTRGDWEWRDGTWCRTLSEGPRGPSPEDCQTWVVDDAGNFVVTRNRGAGASFTYVAS